MIGVELHASPLGNRVGLFHRRAEDGGLTVLVLPKMWGEDASGKALLPSGFCVADDHVTVVMYETGRQRLRLPEGVVAALEENGRRPANADVRSAAGEGRQVAGGSDSPMLVVRREVGGVGLPELPASALAAVQDALVHLLARGEQAFGSAASGAGRTAGMNAGSDGGVVSDSLHFLTHRALVQAVSERLLDIRRGYVPTEEAVPVIRGSLTSRGLVQVASRMVMSFECQYDDFSECVPLYQVLVTALDHVSAGAGVGLLGLPRSRTLQAVRDEATALRSYLASIPSLPLALARDLAARLRLNRLQASWAPALELARQILWSEAARLSSGNHGGAGIEWSMETPKLWEGVLRQAVELDEVLCLGPTGQHEAWRRLGHSKSEDFVLVRREAPHGERIVLDAKYKRLHGTPSMGDQYQIFAYAVLNQARVVSLVFAEPPGRPPRPIRTFVRGDCVEASATASRLTLCALPFPGPGDLGESEWLAYIHGCWHILRALWAEPC
jgi:hypothetical protein